MNLDHLNAAKLWQDSYENFDFDEELDALWLDVKPLYQSLHTYVKNKLTKLYGKHSIIYVIKFPMLTHYLPVAKY